MEMETMPLATAPAPDEARSGGYAEIVRRSLHFAAGKQVLRAALHDAQEARSHAEVRVVRVAETGSPAVTAPRPSRKLKVRVPRAERESVTENETPSPVEVDSSVEDNRGSARPNLLDQFLAMIGG